MSKRWRRWLDKARSHRYGATLFVYLSASVITGIGCAYFNRAFDWVRQRMLDPDSLGWTAWILMPLVIWVAVEAIRRLAPPAAGSGIPQAIFMSSHGAEEKSVALRPLYSPGTLTVKIATLFLALWAGASVGREGPTVHVAMCLFLTLLIFARRWITFQLDLRSAAIAAGAAGLAAAFNTPLAGVTFAVEELTEQEFANIKDFVLTAIILAALAAKTITGEYLYFGRLREPSAVPIGVVAILGLAGGLAGALFSYALLKGVEWVATQKKQIRILWPAVCGVVLLGLARMGGAGVLGPGNEVAQELLRGHMHAGAVGFSMIKAAATLVSYCSGIAGGIFAPCLSIGASLGAGIGQWLHAPVATCALIGMAAFLSGAIQAPITSFVIIFEMTGHHQMLIPIMLAALVAFMIARLFQIPHLYQSLAHRYDGPLSATTPGPF